MSAIALHALWRKPAAKGSTISDLNSKLLELATENDARGEMVCNMECRKTEDPRSYTTEPMPEVHKLTSDKKTLAEREKKAQPPTISMSKRA